MYKSILIPTDGSKGSLRSVEHALDLASEHDAVVHTLFVVDERRHGETPALGSDELYLEAVEEEGMAMLDGIVAKAAQRGLGTVQACCRGIPSEEIRRYVEKHDIDLVVMGHHGNGRHGHTHLGGTIDEVKTHLHEDVVEV